MTVNSDCVIRTSFYKYFHPKEAYIHNGILNEEVTRVVNGYSKEPKGGKHNAFMMGGHDDDEEEYQKESKRTGVDFVYVNGASLKIANPANAILTSGPLTYPCNRAISAVYQHPKGGKMIVMGSVSMFNDDYFEQEENSKLMDFFLKYFFTEEVDLEFPKDDNEGNEYVYVPDIAEIADNLKSCFHVLPQPLRKATRSPRTSTLCSRLISSSTTSRWCLISTCSSRTWNASKMP